MYEICLAFPADTVQVTNAWCSGRDLHIVNYYWVEMDSTFISEFPGRYCSRKRKQSIFMNSRTLCLKSYHCQSIGG